MKRFCGLVMICMAAGALFAQEYDHVLSLHALTGVVYGRSEEIVYMGANTTNKLSQLLWDMKPLIYTGGGIEYRWDKPENPAGIFVSASCKAGGYQETGVMEDRDWMNTQYPDWLTHYSVSDNTTDTALLVDARAGVSFKITEQLRLQPFVSYSFMGFSWTAKGGSILYPDADGGHQYLTVPIDVITYKQDWHIISMGVTFSGVFNRFFDAALSLQLSPSLIWCTDEDNHILRDLLITEKMQGGILFEPHLLFSFMPNDFFTLSLSVGYRIIFDTRGDSVYNDYNLGTRYTYKNGGGVGYSALDAGIMAKFKVFRL
jgi:outer membrane protease